MPLDARAAHKVLGDVLTLGKKLAPGAELAASLTSGRQANTRFAKSEIISAGDVEETEITVTVAVGRRHARTVTNQTDPASLRHAIEGAARLARIAPEDPEHMPVLGPTRFLPVPASFDAATDRLRADARARAAASAIVAAERAHVEVAGFHQHGATARALATSAGLRAYHLSTAVEFTATARTPDGTGSGWAGAFGHRAADVDPSALIGVAIDKAVRSQKPRRLEPGRYTVVLEPAAVGELLEFLVQNLDARRADEGRSFLSRPGGGNRRGEKLFGAGITLRSDPTAPATPAAPFDGEGFPLRPTTWIDQGTLTALTYSRYWAEKQGRAPTGRPDTFLLAGGSAPDAAALLEGVDRGVLITRFWYTRYVDPQSLLITGLTRDGVFLIEKGQVVAPVNNFRFNESPVTMLKNADAMTARVLRAPIPRDLHVPTLRTHEFNLASVSDAV